MESINEKSRFSSYRSNRFYNVFDNASALVYHKDHILDFLGNKVSHDNLKLQSITADLNDADILSTVSALAHFNYLVTNPYWMLLNSYKSYADFPPYVKLLQQFFTFNTGVPVFSEFITPSLNISGVDTDSDTFRKAFKLICEKSSEVLSRQLNDFIGYFLGNWTKI